MADKEGKILSITNSLLDKIKGDSDNSDKLNFSKGFTYKNQDLSNVHNSAEEIDEMRRRRLETYLGMSIPTEEPSDEYIMNYAKSLTGERSKIASNLADQGYDFNESVAYLDNYERLGFINPMGKGLEIFQKSMDNMDYKGKSLLDTVKSAGKLLLGGEVAGFLGNEIGDSMYRRMTRPTDMDVQRAVTDDRTKGKYNSAKAQYDKVTGELKGMSEGDDGYEMLKKKQEYWKSEMNRLDKEMRQTTVDVLEEEGLAGNHYDLSVDTDVRAYEKWTQELEDVFNEATVNYRQQDLVDSILTRENFPNVSDEAWKKYYEPKIKEIKETYKNANPIDLRGLEDWKKKYKPSKESLAGDYATTAEKAINDKLYYSLGEKVKAGLDATKEGAGNIYKQYGLLEERAGAELDKLKGQLTQEKKGITKDIKEGEKSWKSKFARQLRDKSNYIRPSKRLEKAERTLTEKLGIPQETAKSITKGVEKGESYVAKAWKFGGRFLAAVTPLLDVLAITDELSATEKRYELMPMYLNLQKKKLWKLGFDEGTDYEGWTEKDREDAGLGQDVIRDYLDSDEYQKFLEMTTYKWTDARGRALESDSIMYY